MARRLISSGSSFEREIGYSRAVVCGDCVFVAGTTGFDYSTMTISADIVAQTEQCIRNIESALQQVAHEWLDEATLQRRLEADGALDRQYRRPDLVDTLHGVVWGQGFAPPVFCEEVRVVSQRIVGERHLALKLQHQGQAVDGIWFGRTQPLSSPARLAFRLDADEWQGQRRVRFVIEAAEG